MPVLHERRPMNGASRRERAGIFEGSVGLAQALREFLELGVGEEALGGAGGADFVGGFVEGVVGVTGAVVEGE